MIKNRASLFFALPCFFMLFLGVNLSFTDFLCAREQKPRPIRLIVGTIDLIGNRSFNKKELGKNITVKINKSLINKQLSSSVQAIDIFYRNKGFMNVVVSTALEAEPDNRVDVQFNINEGLQFWVSSITLTGNGLISSRVILRDFGIKSGDPFSLPKITEGTRNLYGSRYFQNIDVYYSTASDQRMNIFINVRELATKYTTGSVGYGAETKERLTVGYEDINFLGNARKLNIKGTLSGFLTNPGKYQTTLIEGSLIQPHFFNTRLEAFTSISQEYNKRESYDSAISSYKTALTRYIGRSLTSKMNLRFDGTRISNVTPEAQAQTDGFYRIFGVGPSIAWDNTDALFLPENGWRTGILYEQGFAIGNQELKFYKSQMNAGYYATWKKITFFNRIQAGFLVPDSPEHPIPIQERFTLGGANTVRGYAERDLGPKDANGSPLGGEAFLAGNMELRHPLYKQLSGIIFLDAGQLWSRDPATIWPLVKIKGLDDMAYGTGFGFRYLSPVGPIRLEFGYQLNPLSGTKIFLDRVAVHFALGEPF